MRIIKSLKLEIYSDNIYKDIMAARVPRQLRLISLLRYLSHYYVTHHVTTLLVSLLRYSSRYYVTRLVTAPCQVTAYQQQTELYALSLGEVVFV